MLSLGWRGVAAPFLEQPKESVALPGLAHKGDGKWHVKQEDLSSRARSEVPWRTGKHQRMFGSCKEALR